MISFGNRSLSGYTIQQLVDGLTQAQKNLIFPRQALKTFQTVSPNVGDDGYYQKGLGGSTVLLLPNDPVTGVPLKNAFGNNNRFTDLLGLQIYATPYVIDHLTGYGWGSILSRPIMTYVNALADAEAFTVGGFTDFRLPNFNELGTLKEQDGAGGNIFVYGAPVFQASGGNYWTSTIFDPANSFAQDYLGNMDASGNAGARYVPVVRNHYV